jgi:hypothetical protein
MEPSDPDHSQDDPLSISRRRLLKLGAYVAPTLLTLTGLIRESEAAVQARVRQRVTVQQQIQAQAQAEVDADVKLEVVVRLQIV